MAVFLRAFFDKSKLIFDEGKFDRWCVYLIFPNGNKTAPKDIFYFTKILRIAKIFGHETIYNDFILIYELTDSSVNLNIFDKIDNLAKKYKAYENEIIIWFSVLYAGMIAEENKEHAILKKRIKRLGMHQVLIDKMEPAKAAVFSKNKNWRELDQICKLKGF